MKQGEEELLTARENEAENWLPARDFFDYTAYTLPTACSYEGDGSAASWAVLTLPMDHKAAAFLAKMLQAVGVADLSQAWICQRDITNLISLSSEWQALSAKNWLIFGRTAQSVGWSFDVPMYQLLRPTGRAVIFADALAVLENDMNKKKQLWGALQQLK
jgi:hypothetical protein